MIPIMPDEYKGKLCGPAGGNKGEQRKWTKQEVEWLKKMLSDGYSRNEIAKSMSRSIVSIELKQKRLGKKNGNYNKYHILDKYNINQQFLDVISPKSVLDVYCGKESFYKKRGYNATTNDINNDIDADYHKDALKLMCELYCKDMKYDLIDLDPFGSAYDCFDLAIKMAKKGIIITFGEIGHKRWKRYDFIGPHYGIYNESDFTIDKLIKRVQDIGKCNKKDLVVFKYREWGQIGRVWFVIKKIKVTEQWGDKDGKNIGM